MSRAVIGVYGKVTVVNGDIPQALSQGGAGLYNQGENSTGTLAGQGIGDEL